MLFSDVHVKCHFFLLLFKKILLHNSHTVLFSSLAFCVLRLVFILKDDFSSCCDYPSLYRWVTVLPLGDVSSYMYHQLPVKRT